MLVILVLAAGAAVGWGVTTGEAAPAPHAAGSRPSVERGDDLFFHETFGGNGRTCATCHDPRNEFTVSPELVRDRYKADPTHPLFRPIDSDDGAGQDYTTLLHHALFRVTVPLARNVTLVGNPSQRTITVWRGAPSISNVVLTAPYLQDGNAATLQQQAAAAIEGHMQPSRLPTARELDAIAAFENEMFYPLRLRSLLDDVDPLPKPPGFSAPLSTPAAHRGKAVFDLHCRSCHDGETGHVPELPTTRRFASVFVSERNLPQLPLLSLSFRQRDGTEMVALTPDPGRAAITGDLLDLNGFDIPPIRGVKHTAPYFHDNSAATLGELVDLYNDHFQFHLSDQDKRDLVTYLELL